MLLYSHSKLYFNKFIGSNRKINQFYLCKMTKGWWEMLGSQRDRIKYAYRKLYDALIKGGIDRIIKEANQIFQSPVLLTDENYQLLCQIPKQLIENDIWDTLLKKRKLPAETIWEYQTQFLNDQKGKYKAFYADWGPVKNAPRIFGEVRINGRIVGHVAIFLMQRQLEENDLDIAQILIDVLTIEMMKKERHGKLYLSYSTTLLDLLDPNSLYKERHNAVERLKGKISGNYVLFVTPIGKKASEKAFASYFVIELSQIDDNVLSVLYNDTVVTLVGEINHNEVKLERHLHVKKIISFLEQYQFVSGVSDCFIDFNETSSRFRQALLTAKIAVSQKDTTLAIFTDYAPMQLFLDIEARGESQTYIHPILDKIRNYDVEHHTEYFETLRIYILNVFNKNKALSKLSIHRNTLSYRLNKIKETFLLNYDEEQTAFHLYCSFMLLEASEIIS